MPRTRILAATAAVLASAPAQSQQARPSVLAMDVAGVRLGMTMAQATAALKGRYRCTSSTPTPSFAQLVGDEVTKRRGGLVPWGRSLDEVGALTCTGPDRELMSIDLAQTAAGPVVDAISLRVSADAVDARAVRPRLAAKYGPPTIGDALVGTRCDAGYRCAVGMLTRGPYLVTDTRSGLEIMAARGADARDADGAAVMAAAERIAPRKRDAAF